MRKPSRMPPPDVYYRLLLADDLGTSQARHTANASRTLITNRLPGSFFAQEIKMNNVKHHY
ncbi:MAG: hypothetical protein ACREO5_12335, partial [Candidatus Binatia bacterium]